MKLVGLQPVGPVEGFVPEKMFAEHERLFPQVAIDIVVVHGRSFLLVRRSSQNRSGQGLWATVGGRVRKNETLENGANRILARETGMNSKEPNFEFKGVNQFFDERAHCISVVLKTRAPSKSVFLDETSSAFGWFTKASCPPSLIPYYRKTLLLAGLDVGSEGWSEV